MEKLIVLPLNTEIEKPTIEQIAEATIRKFKSKYSGINVMDHRSITQSSYRKLFSYIEESEMYGFSLHGFNGYESINTHLYSLFGNQDVLAITDIPIITLEGKVIIGSCDQEVRTSIVSKFSIDVDPNDLIQAITNVCIHETGHILGLYDHIGKLNNGKYCVMTQLKMIKEDINDDNISQSEAYGLRSNDFCLDCQNHLKNNSSKRFN